LVRLSYGAILRLITDPQAIAALEQLIRETRYPVACKFGRGRNRYYRSDRHTSPALLERFARDSALEGDGFEPSVPRQIFSAARTCAIEPRALRQAEQWINARRIEWEHGLDGLGEYLKT
jgi:hypothetical protein